jgi:hypothetical protein
LKKNVAIQKSKRGVGRPPTILQVAPEKSLPERIETIRQHHEMVKSCFSQAAMHVVLCGFELIAARAQLSPDTPWEEWVEKNCEFSRMTAYKYCEAAKRKHNRIPEFKRISGFALGVSPESLSVDQRKELFAAVREATDGETIQQMYFDLDICRKPSDYEPGGNAKLIAWLLNHHPDCKAKKFADLPPAIKKEWNILCGAEINMQENARTIGFWKQTTAKLFSMADRGTHKRIPSEVLEECVNSIRVIKDILLKEMQERATR